MNLQPSLIPSELVACRWSIFEMLKFRTMLVDADTIHEQQLLCAPVLKREYDEFQKFKNDPRITRAGRLIRRLSIDELLHRWNVLTGSMSLVGPRPLMINQRDLYGKAGAETIRVVPGITDLRQISGRNLTSFQMCIELDMEYFHNWSVWMDVYILARTIWVVLRCEGVG